MNLIRTVAFMAATALALTTAAAAEDITDTSWRKTAAEVEWAATPFGVEAAPVWGDLTTGPHLTLIHFDAGHTTPVHTHTGDYAGVVVKGTMRHWIPGHPETQVDLGPGSVWSIPGGLPHVSECLSGEECVAVLNQEEGLDFLVAD